VVNNRKAAQSRKPLDQHDVMVPDPQVCREFGITSMTLLRWTRDPHMDFPPPIKFSDRPKQPQLPQPHRAGSVQTAHAGARHPE
jgi:hypothetical protein